MMRRNRLQYTNLRSRLLVMARLVRTYNAKWSLEPDWKFLLAALLYENASLRASTGNLNVLRYLRDSLGVAIDAHSHEGSGYNYTDVAHFLDSLGVGGSTVIGVWRPISRDRYFEDDPAGNITAIGAWRSDVAGISELFARYKNGQTATTCMLTASMPVSPSTLIPPNAIADIEASIIKPLAALRDSSKARITDFTTLVATWTSTFSGSACIYRVTAQ